MYSELSASVPHEADSSIRFSFGRFTTDDEIEEATRLDCSGH